MESTVSTRFLVISDTHGEDLNGDRHLSADVAIHCGDLTEESKIEEFKTSIQLLKKIQAPLKLVIAGNHDFTMDILTFKKKLEEIEIDNDLIRKEYGAIGEVRDLFESQDAKAAGIVFLDEGTHHFTLANGATLTVYASPYTPSLSDSGWGFQYYPQREREWAIDSSTAGRKSSFILCYRTSKTTGHIHEGWGAKKITWRDEISETPSHFTDIDNDESAVIENLSGIRAKKFDAPDVVEEKHLRRRRFHEDGYVAATGLPLEAGRQTLFVNAAIEGMEEGQQQWSWMVDIELPKAKQAQEVAGKKRKSEDSEDDTNKRRSRPKFRIGV